MITQQTRRSTLIIGYGHFGLKVMEQLLYHASMRDVLVWGTQHQKASLTERYLRDLALVHIKDHFKAEPPSSSDHSNDEFEMFQDLYSQIKKIDQGSTTNERSFAQAIVSLVEAQLLSAATRHRRDDDTQPLGLDMIVLLHPEDVATIGFFNRLLATCIEQILNQNPNLRRGTHQSSALCCIKIIDFDNYWENSANELRKAVSGSINFWQKRRHNNKPGFERIYFIDGHPRHSSRDETHRIAEIALFLEFLLFEGQRTGDLELLYKTSAGPQESIVSSFGIRVIEHNIALLRKLAAAWFCVGWLDYMARAKPTHAEEQPKNLRENLASYLPAQLETILGKQEIHNTVENYFFNLEETLLSLSIDDQAWPSQAKEAYEQMQKALEMELTQQVHQRVRQLSEEHLAHLDDALKTSIEADMRSRTPVTLSAIIEEVNISLDKLESDRKSDHTMVESHPQNIWRYLTDRHAEYLHFKAECINIEGHKQWWFLAALMLSLGLTPSVIDVLAGLPEPDKLQTFLLMLHNTLQTLNNPFFISILLFVPAWFIGITLLQRRVRLRVEWAKICWHHGFIQKNTSKTRHEQNEFEAADNPQKIRQGRLVGDIRRSLQPEGVLRQPLESFANHLLDNMALSIRAEVRRELRRVHRLLSERQREMIWLESQLTQYLKKHHLEYHSTLEQQKQLGQTTTDVRYSVEEIEDIKEILRIYTPDAERYRAAQAEVAPFEKWDAEYNENNQGFLYPIDFIETVAERLGLKPQNNSETKLTQQFSHFISQQNHFAPAFHWPPSEGVPAEQRYCVLPPSWRRFNNILHELQNAGIANNHILDGHDDSRAYLLRIQTGIDPNCLYQ